MPLFSIDNPPCPRGYRAPQCCQYGYPR